MRDPFRFVILQRRTPALLHRGAPTSYVIEGDNMDINDSIIARFWAKVDKSGECWVWTAYCDANGYGHLSVGTKMPRAHRVSWTIHNGPIPEGICVLHTCDNPPCVRPDHLWLGSRGDNSLDMKMKGRGRTKYQRGEANDYSKLTETNVLEIRHRYAQGNVSQYQLAREIGVCVATICHIVNRITWNHI